MDVDVLRPGDLVDMKQHICCQNFTQIFLMLNFDQTAAVFDA